MWNKSCQKYATISCIKSFLCLARVSNCQWFICHVYGSEVNGLIIPVLTKSALGVQDNCMNLAFGANINDGPEPDN